MVPTGWVGHLLYPTCLTVSHLHQPDGGWATYCSQCTQCTRSIQCLTCSDLLSPLSALGSYPPYTSHTTHHTSCTGPPIVFASIRDGLNYTKHYPEYARQLGVYDLGEMMRIHCIVVHSVGRVRSRLSKTHPPQPCPPVYDLGIKHPPHSNNNKTTPLPHPPHPCPPHPCPHLGGPLGDNNCSADGLKRMMVSGRHRV
jgi:hypothetical protein